MKKLTGVKKIIVFITAFNLLFQQLGFAQTIAMLDFAKFFKPALNNTNEQFRPVQMRYFSYNLPAETFNFFLDKGDLNKIPAKELKNNGKVLFDYFLIGISLANDKFWVNLRPDTEEQVIDEELARTDLGKILLEADLELKKDTAIATSPDTATGKEYWQKLYQKADELFGTSNVTIPTLTRPWIVPGEVIVRYTDTSAYIYKATLKVMLEQDYLKDSAVYKFDDARLKELNEYSSQLVRELILPEVTKKINTSKKYASLRQVFCSLVLAQCFKLKFGNQQTPYKARIDSGDLSGLTSKESWSTSTYFNAYKKSFEKGEYNAKATVSTLAGQQIRTYFSGGMQLVIPAQQAATTFLPSVGQGEIGSVLVGQGFPAISVNPQSGEVTPVEPSVERTDSGSVSPKKSAGFEDRPNLEYNNDINPAIRAPRKNAFSRKFTLPYARDNNVFRTLYGREHAQEIAEEVLQEVEAHAKTVVFGKDFKDGQQVVGRTSTDANMGWTDEMREGNPGYLLKQAQLTQVGIPALMRGDYATYVRSLREYAESRTQTSKIWLKAILAARRGEKGLPRWAYRRWEILQANQEKYKTFFNLFAEFDKHAQDPATGEDPATYDLYAPAEIGKAIAAANAFSERTGRQVAVFPLGAGGFGSVCAVVGEDEATVIEFLNSPELKLKQLISPGATKHELAAAAITEAEAKAIVGGTGTLAFWKNAKAGREGVKVSGWEEWDAKAKELTGGAGLDMDMSLPWVVVNKNTLQAVPIEEAVDADGNVDNERFPKGEWVVAKAWDVDFDGNKYFRLDQPILSPENLALVAERQMPAVEGQTKTLREVLPKLLSWAQENGKKIIFSAPVRWLDTLGSSWDLVDFRLSGTPEGDLRLELLPACNAIPSEYRVELTLTPTNNPNIIEYESEKYFPKLPGHTYRVDPSKVEYLDTPDQQPQHPDSILFVPHPEKPGMYMLKRREADIPGLFAHLFGVKGGLHISLSQMSFVPQQGGMESSNIFNDLIAFIMATLSGARFSIPEISHISLMSQINECNNITGNQGADAAWAGAGLHIYLGGVTDTHAQRPFAAVSIYPPGYGTRAADEGTEARQRALGYQMTHPVWGFNHSNVTDTVADTIQVEQQGIQLSREQLKRLEDAVDSLPMNIKVLLARNTIVFLQFSDGLTAHRSLGRPQIEIDLALLEPGRIGDLANRLWHEVMEREMILATLDSLGLIEAFNRTQLSPRERETTMVTVAGQSIALADVVDNISAAVHQALTNLVGTNQQYSTTDIFWNSPSSWAPVMHIASNLFGVSEEGQWQAALDQREITREQLIQAAERVFLTQAALSSIDISQVPVLTVDLTDINPNLGTPNIGLILRGSLPTPIDFLGGNPSVQTATSAVDTLAPGNPGGIDFRYIGLMTKFEKSDFKNAFTMPDLSNLKAINLSSEKAELEKMLKSGIMPSAERLTDYLAACYLAKGKEGGSQEAVSCLTKYFRLEEDNVVAETDPQLRSFIWFMESEGIAG